MVTCVPYSMGRMEYNWCPDAASFKPERWLKDGFFQNASPFKFTAFQLTKLFQGCACGSAIFIGHGIFEDSFSISDYALYLALQTFFGYEPYSGFHAIVQA
ncbi:cytochrome p450 704b1 [Quercus suber]|uniref:Cytochrome p450 704b1 n=1 Tax=Quercus suber TaxID=58331 RepID=A0AAW0LLN9_QUESU